MLVMIMAPYDIYNITLTAYVTVYIYHLCYLMYIILCYLMYIILCYLMYITLCYIMKEKNYYLSNRYY